ncbi:MAG: hypothetical protein FWG85_05565, partial [Bacteroidetes bacterium]|nr:hypothetical protein [Bacteroidota bacterium]
LPRAIFSLDGGYSRRTGKIHPDLSDAQKDYFENFISGFAWDISGSYISKSNYGVRLTYLQHLTSHSENAYNEYGERVGSLTESHTITYIGPAITGYEAFGKNKNWIINSYAGVGYMRLYSHATTIITNTNYFDGTIDDFITGSTIGYQAGIGLDYKITPLLGVGINAELIGGQIKEIESNGYTVFLEQTEGIGQFRIIAGIRYYIK